MTTKTHFSSSVSEAGYEQMNDVDDEAQQSDDRRHCRDSTTPHDEIINAAIGILALSHYMEPGR